MSDDTSELTSNAGGDGAAFDLDTDSLDNDNSNDNMADEEQHQDSAREAAAEVQEEIKNTLDHGKLTPEAVHTALNSAGYICDMPLATKVFMSLNTDPVAGGMLKGPSGAGKTWLTEMLANVLGAEYFYRQCNPETREGQLLLDLWPDEDTKSGIKKIEGPITKAVRASHEQPTILCIDEWDKTKPSADAFLLDFLQYGRIVTGDINMRANLDNLIVFVTLNDERDLSEPLRRRMPFIEFSDPHPSLVKQALIQSHGANPYIPSLVELYIRGTMSNMDKPVTIHELRQVLDQAIALGDQADWNMLVRQFISKNERNHQMLKQKERADVSDWEEQMSGDDTTLDPSVYGQVEIGDGEISDNDVSTSMPSLADVKEYHTRRNNDEVTPDLKAAFGVLRNEHSVYNEITKIHEPGESPDHVGWARVEGDNITIEESIPLEDRDQVENLWGNAGEVMFSEPLATLEDMRVLQEKGLEFTSYSESEIIGSTGNGAIDVRWTPENGAEIIVDLMSRSAFESMFSAWVYFNPEPTEVLARLDLNEGAIDRRREGIEPTVYFASVEDNWGSEDMGTNRGYIKDIQNLEGFDSFTDLVQDRGRVVRVPASDSSYYLFENVMFGFIGDMNDEFALSITGPVDEDLMPFIKKWAYHNKVLLRRTVKFDGEAQDLIDDHGFELTKKELIRKLDKGYAAIYRDDGVIRIGSRLRGNKLTASRMNKVIKEIKKAEADLLGE